MLSIIPHLIVLYKLFLHFPADYYLSRTFIYAIPPTRKKNEFNKTSKVCSTWEVGTQINKQSRVFVYKNSMTQSIISITLRHVIQQRHILFRKITDEFFKQTHLIIA